MRIEERLRAAFRDRAAEVEPSPQAIFEINARVSAAQEKSGFRLQFRPGIVLAGAVCALLAAVAVLSAIQNDPPADEVGVFDNSTPAPTTDADEPASDSSDRVDTSGEVDPDDSVAAAPETATPDPTAGVEPDTAATGVSGLPSPERARVIWPTSLTPAADWPTSADDAAAGFVSQYLGLSPSALEPAANNGSTATAVLNSPRSGSVATTLELAAFDVGDNTKRWAVVAARSPMISVDAAPGAAISNPAVIVGSGEGLGGNLLLRLYSPSETPAGGIALGQATAVAGTVGAPAPFEASLSYPVDSGSSAVLVVTNDGTLGGITAIPVVTAVPVIPCEPEAGDTGAVTVTVHFPCEASEDGALFARVHTAPPSGDGLLGALKALATGPTEAEITSGLYSALPTDPEAVISVAEADGWAVVDMSAAIESSNGPLALSQLNATAFALPAVVAVEYRIEGDCERFAAAIGEGGCRIYSRAGSFPPPLDLEPRALVALAGGDRNVLLNADPASESVATILPGSAGGFRLTGAEVEAEGITWIQVVNGDGALGWLNSDEVTVQPTALSEAHRQLMIDRASDVVAIGDMGTLGGAVLSNKGIWVAVNHEGTKLSFVPASGLRDAGAWSVERTDLTGPSYPFGSTMAEVFGASRLDVISVNRAAAFGTEPPAAFSGLSYISIATIQEMAAEPNEPQPGDEEPTAEPTAEPDGAETAPVVINVYFDFTTGRPQVIGLSAHPLLAPAG